MMKNKVLIFDLDATIYYVGDKVEKICNDRIVSYLKNNLNIDKPTALSIIKRFREKYHYDSEWLSKEFPVSQSEFIEYVCDIPTDVIYQDNELNNILQQLKNTKYIITDSTQKHTKDVLKKMNVDINNFVYVYDAHDMKYIFKYRKECFEQFLNKFNLDAKNCIIFEDNVENLENAKSCEMITVLIKPEQQEKPKYVDYLFPDIKTALKELFFL